MNISLGQKICDISDDETLYLSDSDNIKRKVCMWSFNRPIEEKRVDEIKDYIEKTNTVDGIIYIAQIYRNIGSYDLVCYDGNHRYEALCRSNKKYKVLISVLNNASDDLVSHKYNILNSCKPVPSLYKDMDNKLLKNLIRDVMFTIKRKWKNHVSNSVNYHKPNFNPDIFIDELYNMLRKRDDINYIDEVLLSNVINRSNEYYKLIVLKNLSKKNCKSKKMYTKCVKNDCYLFSDNNHMDVIEIILEEEIFNQ